MIVQKISIKPIDSGCIVELQANGKRSVHAFSKMMDAIDFITPPLLTTEKRNDKTTKEKP